MARVQIPGPAVTTFHWGVWCPLASCLLSFVEKLGLAMQDMERKRHPILVDIVDHWPDETPFALCDELQAGYWTLDTQHLANWSLLVRVLPRH